MRPVRQTPPPRLLYTEDELREIRKLQSIALVEREETSPIREPQQHSSGRDEA